MSDLENFLTEIIEDKRVDSKTKIKMIKEFKQIYFDTMNSRIMDKEKLIKHNNNLKLYDDAILKLEKKDEN